MPSFQNYVTYSQDTINRVNDLINTMKLTDYPIMEILPLVLSVNMLTELIKNGNLDPNILDGYKKTLDTQLSILELTGIHTEVSLNNYMDLLEPKVCKWSEIVQNLNSLYHDTLAKHRKEFLAENF